MTYFDHFNDIASATLRECDKLTRFRRFDPPFCDFAVSESRLSTQSGRSPALLDHLVGAGEDRGWDGEPESLGDVEIDHQLEGRRLLDRQIGGLGAVEYLPGVDAKLANSGSDA